MVRFRHSSFIVPSSSLFRFRLPGPFAVCAVAGLPPTAGSLEPALRQLLFRFNVFRVFDCAGDYATRTVRCQVLCAVPQFNQPLAWTTRTRAEHDLVDPHAVLAHPDFEGVEWIAADLHRGIGAARYAGLTIATRSSSNCLSCRGRWKHRRRRRCCRRCRHAASRHLGCRPCLGRTRRRCQIAERRPCR